MVIEVVGGQQPGEDACGEGGVAAAAWQAMATRRSVRSGMWPPWKAR
jgi:hypothetical protein